MSFLTIVPKRTNKKGDIIDDDVDIFQDGTEGP